MSWQKFGDLIDEKYMTIARSKIIRATLSRTIDIAAKIDKAVYLESLAEHFSTNIDANFTRKAFDALRTLRAG